MIRTEQEEAVGHPVTAFSTDGREWGHGMVVSYTDTPSFEVERLDGSRFSWRADMCERDDESRAFPITGIQYTDLSSVDTYAMLAELVKRRVLKVEMVA